MNKTYIQALVLFALIGLVALGAMYSKGKPINPTASSTVIAEESIADPFGQPGVIYIDISGVLAKHVPGGILVRGIWDRDDQGIIIKIPQPEEFSRLKNSEGAPTPYFKAGNNIYTFTAVSTKLDSQGLPLPIPVPLVNVDTSTFIPGISTNLDFVAKDKTHVYIHGTLDPAIDAKSLVAIPGQASLFKDAYHVYEYGGQYSGSKQYDITPYDPKSITFFNESAEYAKDKNGVYFQQKKISGADPKSFIIFTSPTLTDLKGELSYSYAKDKSSVYYNGALVPKADPNTFIPLDSGGQDSYFYGKDANAVYEGTTTIPLVDPRTVHILWYPIYEGCSPSKYLKDATHVFFNSTVVPNADPSTFETLINDYGRDKNGIWQGSHPRPDLPKNFKPVCNYG